MINCKIQDVLNVEPTLAKLAKASENGDMKFEIVFKLKRLIDAIRPVFETFNAARETIDPKKVEEQMKIILNSSAELINCNYFELSDFSGTSLLSVEDIYALEPFLNLDNKENN